MLSKEQFLALGPCQAALDWVETQPVYLTQPHETYETH